MGTQLVKKFLKDKHPGILASSIIMSYLTDEYNSILRCWVFNISTLDNNLKYLNGISRLLVENTQTRSLLVYLCNARRFFSLYENFFKIENIVKMESRKLSRKKSSLFK